MRHRHCRQETSPYFFFRTIPISLRINCANVLQVSSSWYPSNRDPNQHDVSARMNQLDTSPTSRVSGSFSLSQQSEGNGQSGLTGMPVPASSFMFRESGQEQDSVQSDRHLLFGVSIEQQPLGASNPVASIHSQSYPKNKDVHNRFSGNNMLQGSYCSSTMPDISTMNGVGLDENGMCQRGAPWATMSPAPVRTFTKVRFAQNILVQSTMYRINEVHFWKVFGILWNFGLLFRY